MSTCFCPYCVQPIDPEAGSCLVCFAAMGNDALIEMEVSEWLAERRPCPACLKAVHLLAAHCPFCGTAIGADA